jgi:hypothetical protein
MLSHAWLTGATLGHACLASATHDGSSMVSATTRLARAMRISAPKMDQRFYDGDGFLRECKGAHQRSAKPVVRSCFSPLGYRGMLSVFSWWGICSCI